jgi:hypothetical protein
MRETLVEKSDRLAQDFNAQREIRLREERVRRLDTDEGAGGKARAERSRAKERSRTPKSRAKSEVKRSGQKRSDTRKSERQSREAKSRERSRSERAAPEARMSDPFPPLQREGSKSQKPAPAPPPPDRAPTKRKKAQRAEAPLPPARPIMPEVTAPETRSPMDLLAMELEELLREARHGWRNLRGSDKVTLACSVFVMAGVFTPWVSDPAHPDRLGLFSGGIIHLAVALSAMALVIRGARSAGRGSKRELLHQHRRTSLYLVLLGASSTLVGAYLLIAFGLQKSADWPVRFHVGLYWTLAAGTGLSYGGFARFSDLRR